MTASEIGRRTFRATRDFSQDSVRVRYDTSSSTLSRSNLFDIIAEMSSCTVQLLRTLLTSKRFDRESVEPEVRFRALVVRESIIYRRPISEAVTAALPLHITRIIFNSILYSHRKMFFSWAIA